MDSSSGFWLVPAPDGSREHVKLCVSCQFFFWRRTLSSRTLSSRKPLVWRGEIGKWDGFPGLHPRNLPGAFVVELELAEWFLFFLNVYCELALD